MRCKSLKACGTRRSLRNTNNIASGVLVLPWTQRGKPKPALLDTVLGQAAS
jgi:hypothetical protein